MRPSIHDSLFYSEAFVGQLSGELNLSHAKSFDVCLANGTGHVCLLENYKLAGICWQVSPSFILMQYNLNVQPTGNTRSGNLSRKNCAQN
jgi:hypothetical protein